jgi:hypothetical protein
MPSFDTSATSSPFSSSAGVATRMVRPSQNFFTLPDFDPETLVLKHIGPASIASTIRLKAKNAGSVTFSGPSYRGQAVHLGQTLSELHRPRHLKIPTLW